MHKYRQPESSAAGEKLMCASSHAEKILTSTLVQQSHMSF